MKPKIQQSLDDIVFEGRNKAYGAFALRQSYSKTLLRSMFIGSGFVLFFFLSSFAYLKITKVEEIPKTKHPVIVNLLDDEKFLPPNKQEELTSSPPQKSEVLAEIKYPDLIEPVENDQIEIEEVIPDQSELADRVISTENVVGLLTDDSFVIPSLGSPDGVGELLEEVVEIKEESTLISAEIMPEFSGGMSEMYRWLSKNLNYPSNAARNNVQGKVIVSFTVEKNGNITDVKVLKGIGFGCDEETIRVIKAMPKWQAGMQNGHKVRVKYTLPLTFRLDS